MRQKCHAILVALTDEQARRPIEYPWFGEQPISFLELQLYNMRHVQEHAAQLSLFLGQHPIPDAALDWVVRAKDDRAATKRCGNLLHQHQGNPYSGPYVWCRRRTAKRTSYCVERLWYSEEIAVYPGGRNMPIHSLADLRATLAQRDDSAREAEIRRFLAWRDGFVRELGATIRQCDDLLAQIDATSMSDEERATLVLDVLALRNAELDHLRRVYRTMPGSGHVPGTQEREADADRAAGHITSYDTEDEFTTALLGARPDVAYP